MTRENIPVLLEASRAERLAGILTRAHQNEPHFRYIEPDEQARVRLMPTLFRKAIGAAVNDGEIQLAQNPDGCVLWMGPGSELAIVPTVRPRLVSIAQEFSARQLKRVLRVGLGLDQVHRHLVRGHHCYLLALGVEPSVQKDHVRATLLEPLLARANVDGVPCYGETFAAADLGFYMRCGFRIAGCGRIGRSGPEFWAMIREPRPDR